MRCSSTPASPSSAGCRRFRTSPRPRSGRRASREPHARVWLDGWLELPVYDIDALAPGQSVEGPSVVESAATTVLLRHGDTARTSPLGWLDIDLAAA